MARRPRGDEPGSWHHVINRGIAKRPLFETRGDMRFFLARLARQIRLGRIEVHAYCLMLTHFHMLARSPIGALSEAMRRVQNEHSRRFNRMHRRDGTLVRGRFFSKPVCSREYRVALVRYIDSNPVRAKVVQSCGDYEFGSASAYLTRRGPPWLSRQWIEAAACALSGSSRYTPTCYRSAFLPGDEAEQGRLNELVEARLRSTASEDAADDLVGATPVRVGRWLQRKARLADGQPVGLPLCGPRALRGALDEQRVDLGPWMVEDERRTWRGMELAWIGLLRGLCGLPWTEIAAVSGFSESRSRRLERAHRRLLQTNPEYAARSAEAGRLAIGQSLGRRHRGGA